MSSATLVHHSPSLVNCLGQDSRGVSVITPVMAVSICRPAITEGTPSRSGSAILSSRQSSARSLPSRHHFRLLQSGTLPTADGLSSSLPRPHPPTAKRTASGDDKETVSLPKICSPTQLCSNSNSISSMTIDMPPAAEVREQRAMTPEKPSTFPNFRALQRLATSAKLRLQSLKSKEAKVVTAELNEEKETSTREKNQMRDTIVLQRLFYGDVNDRENCSWSSQDEESIQPSIAVEKSGPAGHSRSKTKKFSRSRSRRRAGKSANRKKRKPSSSPAATSAKDDTNGLSNFTLASTMTLNNRWENKKIETFSTKYSNRTKHRRTNTQDTPLHAGQASTSGAPSTKLALTTVALEKRGPALTPRTTTKEQGSVLDSDKGMPTPRMVLEQAATVYGTGTQVSVRLSRTKAAASIDMEQGIKKIFLSEKQSNMLKDCGKAMPCAPPASPTPEQLLKYEYVPSLTDLRSQQALKNRLSVMDAEEKKHRQKQREERARQEKQLLRSNACALRQRQRQEIYALNKVMSELENAQFLKFCESMKDGQT